MRFGDEQLIAFIWERFGYRRWGYIKIRPSISINQNW